MNPYSAGEIYLLEDESVVEITDIHLEMVPLIAYQYLYDKQNKSQAKYGKFASTYSEFNKKAIKKIEKDSVFHDLFRRDINET